MRLRLTAATISILLTAGISMAEPAQRFGRTADGRAYRIDAQGLRLVDQMAELEVTVDELRRQVIALENELETKNRKIERLSTERPGSADTPEVKETNLLPSAKQTAAASDCRENDCRENTEPLLAKISTLEARLRETERRADAAAERSPSLETASATEAKCNYDSPDNPLWAQVQRLQKELMKGPSPEQVAGEARQNDKLAEEILRLKAELDNQSVAAETLKRELVDEREARMRLEAAAKSVKESEEKRARVAMAAAPEPVKSAPEENHGAADNKQTAKAQAPAREEAAGNEPETEIVTPDSQVARRLQQRFLQEIKKIDALIKERKELIDQAKAGSRSYAIHPLVTANGISLDRLRQDVGSLDWTSNSATVEDGLEEIAGLLRKDIASLKRK